MNYLTKKTRAPSFCRTMGRLKRFFRRHGGRPESMTSAEEWSGRLWMGRKVAERLAQDKRGQS